MEPMGTQSPGRAEGAEDGRRGAQIDAEVAKGSLSSCEVPNLEGFLFKLPIRVWPRPQETRVGGARFLIVCKSRIICPKTPAPG